MKLLIVESPGKLKTLRKILGPGWRLEASVGHTTELAHDGFKNLGFDIGSNCVTTRYIPRGSRGKDVLAKLRAAVREADEIYLAMDPDREGEAIAWHLVEQLRLKNFSRVTYSQITENAVKDAIRAPRGLDYPLVHAQRARQCLDKLVGFEVSPMLWNTSGGKSAGRVQSATLHLICEREHERLAFVPDDYWTLHSHYGQGLVAQYEAPVPAGHRSDDEPIRVSTAEEAKRIEGIARTNPHVVSGVEESDDKRLPQPPLMTSSLQQMAGVRLRLSPLRTMQIAQELYEGVGGKSGLITYMRTDAATLSPEFIIEARAWLAENAPDALAERSPTFRSKASAQGAHEAIRPTSVLLTPDDARRFLNPEQRGLYKLIWDRAVASQCKPARLSKTKIEVKAAETKWIARGHRVVDPGYLRFWNNIEEETIFPTLKTGQVLNLKDLKVEKRTTQPPSRYSEAKLVQLMERLGIGRPSTYASTIATLKERDYCLLDKGALAPTALGLSTDDVLTRAMPDLVDVGFTARMEDSLDQIAENKLGWEKFLCDWNSGYFHTAMATARAAIRSMSFSVVARSGFRSATSKKTKRGGARKNHVKGKKASSRKSRSAK